MCLQKIHKKIILKLRTICREKKVAPQGELMGKVQKIERLQIYLMKAVMAEITLN